MDLGVYYLMYLCTFAAGFMLGLSILWPRFESKARLVLDLESVGYDPNRKRKANKRSKILGLLDFLAPLNEKISPQFNRSNIEAKLSSAKVSLNMIEFMALKEVFMLALPLMFYIITLKIDIFPMIILAGLGFFFPDLWLRSRLAKRKRQLIKALPETVDILALCVSGGLDFMLAVRWLLEKSEPNPLIEELATVMYEIKMGRSRRDALKDMAKRLDLSDINSFVRTLVQADRMGTPVSEALNLLSEDARNVRFRRGERLARVAPLKLLIPLIFFILPSILIVIGGPIALRFMKMGTSF